MGKHLEHLQGSQPSVKSTLGSRAQREAVLALAAYQLPISCLSAAYRARCVRGGKPRTINDP